MKNILYFIIFLTFIAGIASCSKQDCNGDLDGMWQLIEWKDSEGSVIATKADKIFYSFQLQMMRFDRKTTPGLYCLSSFEYQGDRIRIFRPITVDSENLGHDRVHEMSYLSPVGVPSDGVMHIDRLSSTELVLSSTDTGVLQFRKY